MSRYIIYAVAAVAFAAWMVATGWPQEQESGLDAFIERAEKRHSPIQCTSTTISVYCMKKEMK